MARRAATMREVCYYDALQRRSAARKRRRYKLHGADDELTGDTKISS